MGFHVRLNIFFFFESNIFRKIIKTNFTQNKRKICFKMQQASSFQQDIEKLSIRFWKMLFDFICFSDCNKLAKLKRCFRKIHFKKSFLIRWNRLWENIWTLRRLQRWYVIIPYFFKNDIGHKLFHMDKLSIRFCFFIQRLVLPLLSGTFPNNSYRCEEHLSEPIFRIWN